jgi:hypothetical protein
LPRAFAAAMPGTDALLGQFASELGDAGEHGRHHPAVWCRQIERHPVQCNK